MPILSNFNKQATPCLDSKQENPSNFTHTDWIRQLSEEEIMLLIQVSNDGTNLGAQISQAKVGVLLHHLEKMRTQVDLIDLLEAFKALVENEKAKDEIRQENLDYAINRLEEAELAIRYQKDWIAPRNFSRVCSCQNNNSSAIDSLPY